MDTPKLVFTECMYMQFIMPNASVKMKLVVVLAVLATVLLVVHADFYIYLFDNTTQRYLSGIDYVDVGRYMVAAKKSPDGYCLFKLGALGQKDEKVSIQSNARTEYFCHAQQGNSSVDGSNYIRLDKPSIDDTCKFEYKLKLDSNNICGTRIALKADNDRYLMVSPQNGINYIKPLATSPVYFNMINPNET